jgi:hypothetical protein
MVQQQTPMQLETNNPTMLAATHRLGSVISQYKSATGSIIFRNILLALLGLLCIATIFTGFSGATFGLLLLGAAMAFYAITRISVAWRNRGTSIHICTEGLMRVTSNAVEAVRWDALSEIWKLFRKSFLTSPWSFVGYILDINNNEISLNKRYGKVPSTRRYYNYVFDKYVLSRPDGSKLVIDKAFGKFKQLSKDLEQGMTSYLVPRMLATYRAGQAIPFGDIAVSTQGISLDNGQKLVPWPELHYVRPVNGYLRIHWKKQGQMFYSNEHILISNIPNVFALQVLVSQIKDGQQRAL